MELANTIFVVVGTIAALLGIATFFNPNFARIIRAPGSPRIKAIISLIGGVILIIVGLLYKFPG